MGGETIGLDGSFFNASASDASITTKPRLEAYTQNLEANDEQEEPMGDGSGDDPALPDKLEKLKARQARKHDQLNPLETSGETQRSRTDPDAEP